MKVGRNKERKRMTEGMKERRKDMNEEKGRWKRNEGRKRMKHCINAEGMKEAVRVE